MAGTSVACTDVTAFAATVTVRDSRESMCVTTPFWSTAEIVMRRFVPAGTCGTVSIIEAREKSMTLSTLIVSNLAPEIWISSLAGLADSCAAAVLASLGAGASTRPLIAIDPYRAAAADADRVGRLIAATRHYRRRENRRRDYPTTQCRCELPDTARADNLGTAKNRFVKTRHNTPPFERLRVLRY